MIIELEDSNVQIIDRVARSFKIVNTKELPSQGTKAMFIIYAPWCGHCKRLLKTLSGISTGTFYVLNGTTYPKVGNILLDKGYPTIYILNDGLDASGTNLYNGKRDKDDIISELNLSGNVLVEKFSTMNKRYIILIASFFALVGVGLFFNFKR